MIADCEKCEELLQPYLDRELSDAEVAEAERHLDTCSYCRKRYRFEEALRRFAADLNRFNNELQGLVSGLHAKMRAGRQWRSSPSTAVGCAYSSSTGIFSPAKRNAPCDGSPVQPIARNLARRC